MSVRRKRSPRGVDLKAIALRLMPQERQQAEEISKQLGLSNSAFAREAYLVGAPLVCESHKRVDSND